MTEVPVKSTKDLTPDGPAGYLKGIAGIVTLIGGILVLMQPYFPESSEWAKWIGIGISVCGAIGTFLCPNKVKPGAYVKPESAPVH